MPQMERADRRPRYVVVSPVKDEERYIEQTLESMANQTWQPALWIIVDDGSSDRTPEIVQRYSGKCGFIQLVSAERRSARATGIAEVHAFNRGFELVRNMDYDYLVKLDGDLSFDADYFQRLLGYFREDPNLGIASGAYYEMRGEEWKEVRMPPYHAAGASKAVRRQCFDDIGGFITQRGWDTVDEIRARSRGWETTHFADLKMKHWKPEGTGMGLLKTSCMHGEIYYRTGGSRPFFMLKAVYRVTCRPYLVGAIALLWGYLSALVSRKPLLVTDEEARCYRALLNGRMAAKLNVLRPPGTH